MLGLACVAGLAAVLAYQFRLNARTRDEIEGVRFKVREIDSLRTEHVRLAAIEPARAKLIHGDQEELERRKIEAEALRAQLMKLKESNLSRTAPEAGALARIKAQAAAVPVLQGMLTPETIQNVGRATPSRAWQTQMWASLRGETTIKAESIAFDQRDHDALQAIFDGLAEDERSGFETPEQMGVSVMAMDSHPVPVSLRIGFPRVQVVTETLSGPDDAQIVTRSQNYNGEIRNNPPIQMHRFPSGWKLMLPPNSSETVLATILAMPPSQRLTLPKK